MSYIGRVGHTSPVLQTLPMQHRQKGKHSLKPTFLNFYLDGHVLTVMRAPARQHLHLISPFICCICGWTDYITSVWCSLHFPTNFIHMPHLVIQQPHDQEPYLSQLHNYVLFATYRSCINNKNMPTDMCISSLCSEKTEFAVTRPPSRICCCILVIYKCNS